MFVVRIHRCNRGRPSLALKSMSDYQLRDVSYFDKNPIGIFTKKESIVDEL